MDDRTVSFYKCLVPIQIKKTNEKHHHPNSLLSIFCASSQSRRKRTNCRRKKIGTEVMNTVNSLSAGNLQPNFIEYVDENTVALTFDGKRFDNPCGIEVNWGDGAVEKVRVEKDFFKNGFKLQHNYPKANQTYELVINGKFIFRGLKTLASCPGDYTDTLKLSVK